MKPLNKYMLIINGGSSSLKFGLSKVENSLKHLVEGEMENVGANGTKLTFTNNVSNHKYHVKVEANDHSPPLNS